MKRKMEVSELIFMIVAYVLLIAFAIMCIYPFLYAIAATFSSADAIEAGEVVILPIVGNSTDGFSIGVIGSSFAYAFSKNEFWISYANTLFTTVIGTIWCMVYTMLGAYALSKKRLLGRHGWNFFLVFTMWFSAGVVPTYLNYQSTGKVFAAIVGGETMYDIDLKWLVVIAMGMNASNIILLRNAFEGVPSEIEEAARIDGATEMQILMNVFVPMSQATIATVALFFGISRWNGYFWAYKVMGTNQQYSWPVQVYLRDFINNWTDLIQAINTDQYNPLTEFANYEGASGTSIAYAMVICAVIPILCIYPFIQKYFAKGVNMGGVKE